MRNLLGSRAAWALSGAALILVGAFTAGCNAGAQRNKRNAASAKTASGAPSWPCSFNIPTIVSTIPNDSTISDQPTLNCFAWQEFIALNWADAPGQRGVADPKATAAQFGTPKAPAPVVWETYKADTEVFLPAGQTPPAWNASPPPPSCSSSAARSALQKPGTRVMGMTSAFGDFALDETAQASGQWLADQNGNLVWYEIRLNQDEFNAIVNNQFYNGSVQLTTASTGKNPSGGAFQVKLPAGCNQGSCPGNGQAVTGTIEVKAAWRVLTDPSQHGRYLTSQAVLLNNGSCTTAMMGLVGLHIIHKTVSQPQFIWATFEQVDNVPPASPATFSSSSCQCQTAIPGPCFKTPPGSPVYENCLDTQGKGQACTPNTPPPYNAISSGCGAYPIQVTRQRPISNNSTDPVVATNTAAQQLITGSNPKSVFQYYQLVDVLWSGSPQDNYTNQQGQPGPATPLSMSGATPDPSALPVANTTMETYVQNHTCLYCHVYASVAGSNTYASDFSFVLGEAQSPGLFAARARKARHFPRGLINLKH